MDGMASSFVGILYAEDFDDPLLPPVPEPEPPPPSFTRDELDAAVRLAQAEAVHQARLDWDRSAAEARTRSLAAIATALQDSRDDANTLANAVATGTVRTILAMVAGVLPDLCTRYGADETRALLRSLLPTLVQQPRITVRVSPAVLDAVRDDVALLDDDLAASIILTGASMPPGDARVTWTDGALIRDQAAIQAAIGTALIELGLLDPTPTPHRSMALAQ